MSDKAIIKALTITVIFQLGCLAGIVVGILGFLLGAPAAVAVVAGIMAALAVIGVSFSTVNHLASPAK